jgi:AmmeMemoRadiSam system protein B
MAREAVVAGQFYPASAQELKKQMDAMIDKTAYKEKAIGVISPHAGYMYSGYVAGAVFSAVEITDTVVIIGPNHTGYGATFSLYKKGVWLTPLGEIEVDSKLSANILDSCNLIKKDEAAHTHEHSIEVQLPFMQYLKKEFKIVPIVVASSSLTAYRDIAKCLAETIKDYAKKVLIVASSDMTHYQPQNIAKEKDNMAIEAILKLDEALLLERVERYNIRMCGYVPAIIMIAAAKLLGVSAAKLIKYQTSGDVSGDYNSVVGYAGVVVR